MQAHLRKQLHKNIQQFANQFDEIFNSLYCFQVKFRRYGQSASSAGSVFGVLARTDGTGNVSFLLYHTISCKTKMSPDELVDCLLLSS